MLFNITQTIVQKIIHYNSELFGNNFISLSYIYKQHGDCF